jgi:DNA repair protein RadD
MVSFDALLARADSVVLQSLVGPDTVRLVAALDASPLTPSKLRSIFTGLRTPHEVICWPEARQHLIDLLTPTEAARLLAQLGDTGAGDPYARLKAMPFRKRSAALRVLHTYFGVESPTEIEGTDDPTAETITPSYPLFPHQYAAVERVANVLSQRPHRVMLHMPTGAGKTRTAMNLVSDHLRALSPTIVLWLAASEELCEQARQEFHHAWSALGNRKVEAIRLWGPHDIGDDIPSGDAFIVAGLQKLYAHGIDSITWLPRLGDRVSLVVFDEAHQAVAPTYRHVVDAITARRLDTQVLGLSATPGRSWSNIDADEALAQYFGQRKVTLSIPGHHNPVHYLIESGYLAKPDFVPIHYPGPTLTDMELTQLHNELDVPLSVLKRLGADQGRNVLILHHVKQLASRHRRTIVFCTSVDQATQLTAVLSAQGVSARCVSGTCSSEQRKDAIGWYKSASDDSRILMNYGVLTTGFDAPGTSAALIARPTKSLVLYSQMVGRAIRGPRAGGNETAEILTVVDTGLQGFGDVEQAFLNWEDVWQEQ